MPEISAIISAIVALQKRNSFGFAWTLTGIRPNKSCSPFPEQTQQRCRIFLFILFDQMNKNGFKRIYEDKTFTSYKMKQKMKYLRWLCQLWQFRMHNSNNTQKRIQWHLLRTSTPPIYGIPPVRRLKNWFCCFLNCWSNFECSFFLHQINFCCSLSCKMIYWLLFCNKYLKAKNRILRSKSHALINNEFLSISFVFSVLTHFSVHRIIERVAHYKFVRFLCTNEYCHLVVSIHSNSRALSYTLLWIFT